MLSKKIYGSSMSVLCNTKDNAEVLCDGRMEDTFKQVVMYATKHLKTSGYNYIRIDILLNVVTNSLLTINTLKHSNINRKSKPVSLQVKRMMECATQDDSFFVIDLTSIAPDVYVVKNVYCREQQLTLFSDNY